MSSIKHKTKLILSCLGSLILLTLVFSVEAHASPVEVKIAFQCPLTGAESAIGQEQLAAINFAVSNFNRVNLNYHVTVLQVDDQLNLPIAISAQKQISLVEI